MITNVDTIAAKSILTKKDKRKHKTTFRYTNVLCIRNRMDRNSKLYYSI